MNYNFLYQFLKRLFELNGGAVVFDNFVNGAKFPLAKIQKLSNYDYNLIINQFQRLAKII